MAMKTNFLRLANRDASPEPRPVLANHVWGFGTPPVKEHYSDEGCDGVAFWAEVEEIASTSVVDRRVLSAQKRRLDYGTNEGKSLLEEWEICKSGCL